MVGLRSLQHHYVTTQKMDKEKMACCSHKLWLSDFIKYVCICICSGSMLLSLVLCDWDKVHTNNIATILTKTSLFDFIAGTTYLAAADIITENADGLISAALVSGITHCSHRYFILLNDAKTSPPSKSRRIRIHGLVSCSANLTSTIAHLWCHARLD